MAAQAIVGSIALVPGDSHGNICCAHTAKGPGIAGSPDVNVNKKPAMRVGDPGTHAACCGPQTWKALTGSATVFINNIPAHRLNDQTQHCGGMGTMHEACSPNVDVGG